MKKTKTKIKPTPITKIIDISLLVLLIVYGVPHIVEALINLGMFRTSHCSILDVGCHGTFGLVVTDLRKLFYLVPICLVSYTGLLIAFFRPTIPSWLFVVLAVFFVVVLYNHHLYGLTNLVYLLAAYTVFRALFIHQRQAWSGISLSRMANAMLKNRLRIPLFLILLVSVTIFFPTLVERIYIEWVDCEKTYQQYCSERRMDKINNLHQTLYLLPVIVLSFIGLYWNERRTTQKRHMEQRL